MHDLPPWRDLGTLIDAMAEVALPQSLLRILVRGTLPHASLIVGGTDDQLPTLVAEVTRRLAVAPADRLVLETPPTMNELRTVLQRLSRTPHQSPFIIAVFGAFESWSEELGTVLLKTLEEPPSHVRILLVARDDSRVLPTIRSRVARFRFGHDARATESSPIPRGLNDQLTWSQASTSNASPRELLAPHLGRLPARCQRLLLTRLTDIADHPVNKRLALDTILTRAIQQETPL